MTPWRIDRSGVVSDRESGELVGSVLPTWELTARGSRLAWEYRRPRWRHWRTARTRREAAAALWQSWQQRRTHAER